MNLRVLIYMNPLSVDKISKRFLIEKDSGFLYTRQLIQQLPDDWRYTILVPTGIDHSFFNVDRVIDFIPYDYSTSIHQNRYHFNRNIIAKFFDYGDDVDVVINNQPEVSANIRHFFATHRRETPILLSFYHWIDCELSRKFASTLSGFFWRQLDGSIHSDLSLFHSNYAINLFRDEVKRNVMNPPEINTSIFSPEPTKFGDKPFELPKKKYIIFNHRNNNSTGWKQVVDTFLKLNLQDTVLWLTDINSKEAIDNEHIIQKNIPFESYGYVLKKALFSVCNTQGYATWNMSVLDSIINGCVPIVPDNEMYHSMLNGTDIIFFKSLESKMKEFYDMSKEQLENIRVSISLPTATNIEGEILNELNQRIINTPLGYETVKAHILENGCNKAEWVNKFWSFHVNSNFQKIRWKLMKDGVSDNIYSKKTIYSKDNFYAQPIIGQLNLLGKG